MPALTGAVTTPGASCATDFGLGTSGYALTGNGASASTYQGFVQSGSGSVTRTWQDKATDTVSIFDKGAFCSAVVNATTTTNAFNNAIATGKRVRVPYCSFGYNIGTNAILLDSGQSVFCDNQSTVVYAQGAKAFYISSAGPETSIENCTVQMAGGVVGATAFLFKTSTAIVNVVTLRNIKCLYTYHCVDDEGTNPVSYFTLDGAYATQTYGLQFRLRNSNGFVHLRNFSCDFTNEISIGLVTWGCGEFTNFIGLFLSGLNVATGVGVGTPAFVPSTPAFKITSGQALWVTGALFADHTAGDGVLVDTVTYVWADRLEGSLNLGTQVTIQNSIDINVANTICYGATGQTGAAASKVGCDFNANINGNFANTYTRNATGDGANVRGTSQSMNFSNLVATGAGAIGLVVKDSATNINFSAAFLGGNTGAGYSNTSSGKVYINIASGGTQWATQAAPGSPAAGNGAFWFDATDLRFHDKNSAGTIGTTAVALASIANNFLTGMGADGTFTRAQPAFSNLSGSATCAQLPALTGDVTTSAGSCADTIAANAVTDAKLRQSAGLSVVGRSANSTGNVADITGTASQILRVSGATLGFGSIDLASSVAVGASVLPGANGGTGLSTAAVGDLIYASATTPTWSRLADVAVGSVMVSGGVNTAPAWSNAITVTNSVTTATLVGTSSTITPSVVGSSSGTTGTQLTLKTTNGVGTTDAMAFVGGNNGGTTFATLANAGLTLGNFGGTSNVKVGATSNYSVVSLNNNIALNGSLGMFGGASGDTSILYLSAPGAVHYYFAGTDVYNASSASFSPVTESAGGVTVGDSTHHWANIFAFVHRSKPQTFANLTACSGSLEGTMASVTDSTTVTWHATITGSGANHVMAYCNGTNWVVAS